jgi:hypothetical protein
MIKMNPMYNSKINGTFPTMTFIGLIILFFSCAKQFPDVSSKVKLTIDSITPSAGGGGASVLIYGKGFSGMAAGNRVYFNGMRATADTIASYNVIKVFAPVNGATGKVSVASNGDSVSGPVFTYLPRPAISNVVYKSTFFFIYGVNFDPQASVVSIAGQVTSGFTYSVSSGQQLLTDPNYTPPVGMDNPVLVVVTAKSVASNTYSFVFDPKITGFGYSRTGNITYVTGSLFGTRQVPSTLRVFYYDSNNQKVYLSPDPTVVSWQTGEINASIPDYFPTPLPYTPPSTYMEVSVQGHISTLQYTN